MSLLNQCSKTEFKKYKKEYLLCKLQNVVKKNLNNAMYLNKILFYINYLTSVLKTD